MNDPSHPTPPRDGESDARVESRRRFIERLKRAGAVAVPLAVVATLDIPEAHAY